MYMNYQYYTAVEFLYSSTDGNKTINILNDVDIRDILSTFVAVIALGTILLLPLYRLKILGMCLILKIFHKFY